VRAKVDRHRRQDRHPHQQRRYGRLITFFDVTLFGGGGGRGTPSSSPLPPPFKIIIFSATTPLTGISASSCTGLLHRNH
jgi:hypothetical protein